jgi:hypothetical protein
MRGRDFPGTDEQTNERLATDVARDEEAMIGAIAELRRSSAASNEAIGFLLGTGPGQISRYLNGAAGVTLTNYIRIARALGYRCKMVLEKAEPPARGAAPLSELKLVSHKVSNTRRPPRM